MQKPEMEQFLHLYFQYRHENQLTFYTKRQQEFSRAQNQAMGCSIGLILLATLAVALEAVPVPWLKNTSLLAAAILPVLSTTLTAYGALYAFGQQAKIYEDAAKKLQMLEIEHFKLGREVDTTDFVPRLNRYLEKVEEVFEKERGQWGQLAEHMKPSDI